MRVKIKDIPENGLSVNFAIPKEEVKGRDYWELASELAVSGKLARTSMSVIIELLCKADKNILCARCLEKVLLPYEISFTRSQSFDSLDREIDLKSIIFQEVELSIPVKELCKDDCKGICPICGVDLNKQDCNCARSAGINRKLIR